MNALAKLKEAFTGSPTTAEERDHADIISRRDKLQAKAGDIAGRKKIAADELATLAPLADEAAAADRALAAGRVALEVGDSPSSPLEVLQKAAEDARKRAEEGQQRAIVLQGVLTAWEAQQAALHDALHACHRELADSPPGILDAQLWAIWPERQAAESMLRDVIRQERVLRAAYDQHAMQSARGEFRSSTAYAALRIPTFTHPKLDALKPNDPFVRGRQLTAEHEAFDAEERAIAREAHALLESIINGR